MNMIDRWECRRKVRGALEVAANYGMGGASWEAVSTDHSQDHTMPSIPIDSCTDIAIEISSSVGALHMWMHLHT